MSLYNMLFGVNEMAPTLLAALGINEGNVPRFRDCYLDTEKKRIVIHTRTGGGNRDFYESEESCRDNHPEYFTGKDKPSGPWNADMRKHPQFLYDRDDDFDATYADFYFSFPPDLAADLTALCENVETHRPSEKWQALFAALAKKEKPPATTTRPAR